MMKKFEISKATYTGKVIVVYNAEVLHSIDFGEVQFAAEQIAAFKKSVPVSQTQLEAFGKWGSFIIREAAFNISFEQWYNEYNLKRNKIEAEKLWNKMPTEEHLTAWLSNKPYNTYCKRNGNWYNKMYPDTYLRGKHYLTEWNKVTH